MIIGSHINTVHGFSTIPKYVTSLGLNVCQIFLRSPRSLKVARRKKSDLEKFKKENEKYKIQVVVHGNYIINLCRDENDDIHKLGAKVIAEDLDDSVIIGAMGVIIHMGSNVSKLKYEQAFENYVKGIKTILKNSDPRSTLILETGCGCGNEVGTQLIELGKFRNKLTEEEKKRVKFCLDTCHMYSAGYDIGNIEYVDMLEKHIECTLGWQNIAVVHLNDSKTKINSKKDRHSDLGKGEIKYDGLVHFVKLCNKYKIPMVLEVPAEEYIDKEKNKYKYTSKDQIEDIRKKIKG